jgi:Asp-tRNA(Asn)/Glu-tRNA(Gln) amidotransferase B subunit
VAEFRQVREALGFFVGQVMKETKGKANPKLLNELFVKEVRHDRHIYGGQILYLVEALTF